VLTIHHLGKSQSERIIWLCEELGLPYDLEIYTRDAKTILAPPALKALHPIGAAPLLRDGDVFLAESGAIMDYILARYGNGRLVPRPDSPEFPHYLYWFHYANGTLQAAIGRLMILNRLSLPGDNPVLQAIQGRMERALALVETRLGEADFFAGHEFTAADIIMVFSLTTMRLFQPIDLGPYPNVRAYLARIGQREAYRRAMQKGDPGLTPLLT